MDNMTSDIKNLSFSELAYKYNFLNTDLILLFEIDKRTLNNWLTRDNAPIFARKLLFIIGRGYLPESDWCGFEIRGGILYTPAGQRITPENILAWFFKEQMLTNYKSVNRRLIETNERLKKIATGSNDSIFDESGNIKQFTLF